ncbi:MAG: hypothetical protein A2381_06835 [Bdellovibrionales bacterium RIFOXYB1_FULL_37_110]|nr:MAG: hypothetical protein A2417_14710 [Bdellovibrionales bacterium RIFOXYC1_FULL_37_79]OFZ57779.1 MAG: hypothetical protein A2381_06835 [Bdellovibrionales bacterium RIFOXYB1_FULL_37_110]OFZ62745.1 MAG: hypothetical protein A2577_16355 [Bdellovibrionales bacterium RIFOXYD1_FULL_36_51]
MVPKIILMVLLMSCSSFERACDQQIHSINYPMIDINQDAQVSHAEFFEYMEHLFGALDKDKSHSLTFNEIYQPSRCPQ